MMAPTPGQIRLAELVLRTELRPRSRNDVTWRRIVNGAVVVTFLFFLLM